MEEAGKRGGAIEGVEGVGMRRIVIEPLGPIRAAARPAPSLGVAAVDKPSPFPPPSTVLGALGALNGVTAECPSGGSPTARAERQLVELAEELGVEMMWGPLIEVEGKLHVAVGDDELAEADFGGAAARLLGRRRIKIARRIGLALGVYKTALPGYLYAASFIAERAKFIYYIKTDRELRGGLVRFGGEGRLALVKIEEGEPPVRPASGIALVISPLLMPEGELPQSARPLGSLKYDGGWRRNAKIPVVQWGLGFSEVCRERRPMYPALPPGTLLWLDKESYGEGHLSRLGYGSLLPLADAEAYLDQA